MVKNKVSCTIYGENARELIRKGGSSTVSERDKQFEKRELRRKRRLKSQVLSYITLALVLIMIVCGCIVAIKYVLGMEKNSNSEMEDHIENLVSNETEISKSNPEDFIPELTPQQKLDEIVNAAIDVMPLEDRVAGLFIVTPEAITGVATATQAGDGTKDALNRYAVGGVVYFSKNIKSAEQISEMINNTVLYSRYPLFIAVDEEGGTVSRVADSGIATNVGKAADIGATADPSNALNAGDAIAGYLTALGFNLDFAPVADLNNVENSTIGNRSYGSDFAIVSQMVTAMVQGLEEGGVSSCLKHFPGIGSSTADTHNGLSTTTRTVEEFRANEFQVFKAGIDAGVDFIMISHMAAPAFSGDNTPSTFSKEVVTDVLRKELNYDGIIITDALNMKAISEYYGSNEAAVMALKAGCDMILMPENFELAYNAVLEAVQNGTISEERINDSLRRIYRVKYADKMTE